MDEVNSVLSCLSNVYLCIDCLWILLFFFFYTKRSRVQCLVNLLCEVTCMCFVVVFELIYLKKPGEQKVLLLFQDFITRSCYLWGLCHQPFLLYQKCCSFDCIESLIYSPMLAAAGWALQTALLNYCYCSVSWHDEKLWQRCWSMRMLSL